MLTEHRLNADSILPGKMRGVGVRPWCWEVAGPWTAAAWFTTPAVPPHHASRWQCGYIARDTYVGFFSLLFHSKAERWLHLPASSRGQHSPLSPFSNLHYICDSCGRKTCKLDSKGIIRSCGERLSVGTRLLSSHHKNQAWGILGVCDPPLYTWQALHHPQPSASALESRHSTAPITSPMQIL